jgi:hypothetical protein
VDAILAYLEYVYYERDHTILDRPNGYYMRTEDDVQGDVGRDVTDDRTDADPF